MNKLAAIVVLALCSPAAADKAKPYEVSAMHAYLYYHSTGKLDDTDIATGEIALFNTMIGEGGASAPSGAMMLLTEITGPKPFRPAGTLVVEVKLDKKRVLKQSIEVDHYFVESEADKVSLPLLVPIDCGVMTVTSTLTMKNAKPSTKRVTISFGCGE